LAKKKKPFEEGNVIRECFVVAGDSLFNEFKNKTNMQCNYGGPAISKSGMHVR
jgi:hypothetical protein